MCLQPVALDKASGGRPGGQRLAKLLEEQCKDAGKAEAGTPPVRGLAGESALRKVMQARRPAQHHHT